MRRLPTLLLALGLLAGLTACSSSQDGQSAFDATATQGCMKHQAKAPAAADQAGKAKIGAALAVLRYYAAHGKEDFCDGKPASAKDLMWMRLFVDQGADGSAVARWLRP